MKELAYKVLALHTLYWESLDVDDVDLTCELQDQMQDAALDLARAAALDEPFAGHTRLAEVFQYANRRQICIHEAIVELVNTALSLDESEV
jgi:hypothetical protein